MRAIILAGGKGRRLLPYTHVLPKPLMPLGERPILEVVVRQLERRGFTHLTIAVGHLAGLIMAYFGDGERFGVRIDYSIEERPLGTAGPLSLIARPEREFLVMNGDLLTDFDHAAFVEGHRASGCIASLAVYRKEFEISLGVLKLDEEHGDVVGYTEKPTLTYPVSTGMYCFRPDIVDHLEPGKPCDLPVLVQRLIDQGERVRADEFTGYWLDIGRPDDYELAQEEAAKGRFDQ